MQSHNKGFPFWPNFHWDRENLFLSKSAETGPAPLPDNDNFLLLEGGDFMLLDADNFKLLE